MTLAAVNWLNISINLLLIVFVLVALLMSLLILMQRPKQEGLGAAFGSGMTDQMFGARTTNVLQKGTVYLASLFFILTLTLAILYAKQQDYRGQSQVQEAAVAEEVAEPAEAPAPTGEESLEETLKELTGGTAVEPGGETTTEPEVETPAGEPATTEPAPGDGSTETPAGEGATEPAAGDESAEAPAAEPEGDAPTEPETPAGQ